MESKIFLVVILSLIFFISYIHHYLLKEDKKKIEFKKQEEKRKNPIKFKEIFGFFPNDQTNSLPEQQQMINTRLQKLANEFFVIAEDQNKIFHQVSTLSKERVSDQNIIYEVVGKQYRIFSSIDYGYGFEKLDHLKIFVNLFVEQKKLFFWQAHHLAKYFHYEVADSIKEYRSSGMMA